MMSTSPHQKIESNVSREEQVHIDNNLRLLKKENNFKRTRARTRVSIYYVGTVDIN